MAKQELSPAEQRRADREREDKQALSKLRRGKKGKTAAQLGIPAARLRNLEGVIEVGRVRTGRAGRPAVIFGLEGVHEPEVQSPEQQEAANAEGAQQESEAEAARSGSANEQLVSE